MFIIFVLFLDIPNIKSDYINILEVNNGCKEHFHIHMEHLQICMIHLHNMYGMPLQPVWYTSTNFCGDGPYIFLKFL